MENKCLPINQIIEGDCLEVMKGFPDEGIDLVATDPPYGIAYQSNYRNKKFEPITGDDGLEWLSVSAELWRVMKPTSSLYLFTSAHHIDKVKAAFDKHFNLRNLLVVKKMHLSAMGDLYGSFANDFELVLFYVKGNPESD